MLAFMVELCIKILFIFINVELNSAITSGLNVAINILHNIELNSILMKLSALM